MQTGNKSRGTPADRRRVEGPHLPDLDAGPCHTSLQSQQMPAAGLHPMCADVLEEGRATSVPHCPISQDGLSPGAVIQQCNVDWSQSSSSYVNETGGGRPHRLFKLWSGAGVCTAVLWNCTESSTALNRNYTSGSRGFNDRVPHGDPPPRLVAASRATD